MTLADIARDITRFTLQNVNDAISFKPHLCHEVPARHYDALRQEYISFTGTSIRKNKYKLYYLPTNVFDELQVLSQPVPEMMRAGEQQQQRFDVEGGKDVDGRAADLGYGFQCGDAGAGGAATVYYKKRLITELDYENVKRVEKACMLIAYAAVNQCLQIETCDVGSSGATGCAAGGYGNANEDDEDGRENSSATGEEYCEECARKSLERGEMLGFRELGYLINITPWHFHRVFKVIAGLTIREYGQLCCDFLKGQEDILFRVRDRVALSRESGDMFSCLEDEEFMHEDAIFITGAGDDAISGANDRGPRGAGSGGDNFVILADYFIDPNKSKELKKKLKEQKSNNSSASSSARNSTSTAAAAADTNNSRVELRKRRYSLMSQRIMKASPSSIKNNPTIMDCLENSTLTREEYERRQKQKHLQRSKMKRRKKSIVSTASAVRKPPLYGGRRSIASGSSSGGGLDSHSILKNAVVKHEGEAAVAAARGQTEHPAGAAVADDQLAMFQSLAGRITNIPSTTSSTSSTSSALLSSCDYEQDNQSLGHFSSPTQSVLDFKFPTSMSSDEAASDLNSVLNGTTPATAATAAVSGDSSSSSILPGGSAATTATSTATATAAVSNDIFGGDSYKYNLGLGLGLGPMGGNEAASAASLSGVAGVAPTSRNHLFYDSSMLPSFAHPTAVADLAASSTAAAAVAAGTASTANNGNYNLTSMTGGAGGSGSSALAAAAPQPQQHHQYQFQHQQLQQQQQLLFDFGPLFDAAIPPNSTPGVYGNAALGTMEYLISSSAGLFEDDDDGL
ncbi:uncharacterized protein Ecym_1277 [Eremothecium cymbalariae DBVPG|uniref:Uncharacterized protein n=1 Tax=Eremothecium cymbalariae (strain CBS 270.75 / DBVPG 7215 / KCTC 17166 / NRRL Y-17582) TaxID=931890 RepID=G8JN54_ERECY|nr:hypothetical protein Ecym_1277 [Eremothecium cymbalariae DBVPG\